MIEDVLGVSKSDDGRPIFSFLCDCGVITNVTTEVTDVIEFAYTCECQRPNWVTIKLVEIVR